MAAMRFEVGISDADIVLLGLCLLRVSLGLRETALAVTAAECSKDGEWYFEYVHSIL